VEPALERPVRTEQSDVADALGFDGEFGEFGSTGNAMVLGHLIDVRYREEHRQPARNVVTTFEAMNHLNDPVLQNWVGGSVGRPDQSTVVQRFVQNPLKNSETLPGPSLNLYFVAGSQCSVITPSVILNMSNQVVV
jgi:hypothetical protein